MKRNEFMQIEAEEDIKPNQEEYGEIQNQPSINNDVVGYAPDAEFMVSPESIADSVDIQPASYPYQSVEGPRPSLPDVVELPSARSWSAPFYASSDIPTRTINENDAEYVERCIRYIIDRGNIRDTHVRRVLYQTMSSLTDIPSAPPAF